VAAQVASWCQFYRQVKELCDQQQFGGKEHKRANLPETEEMKEAHSSPLKNNRDKINNNINKGSERSFIYKCYFVEMERGNFREKFYL
jgi:hypothetical protein